MSFDDETPEERKARHRKIVFLLLGLAFVLFVWFSLWDSLFGG